MVSEPPPRLRFHLALPVRDLAETRAFYTRLLRCSEGRASSTWVDFEFFGHQLSAHLAPVASVPAHTRPVDGKAVPVPISASSWDGKNGSAWPSGSGRAGLGL